MSLKARFTKVKRLNSNPCAAINDDTVCRGAASRVNGRVYVGAEHQTTGLSFQSALGIENQFADIAIDVNCVLYLQRMDDRISGR
jgi:hypothetical protein